MTKIYEGHYLNFNKQGDWEYVSRRHCRGAVILVTLTEQKELVLVEQYRTPVQSQVLELPAGLVGDKDAQETWEEAAQRELIEETGYEAKKIEFFFEGPTSAGLTDEKIRIYLATDLKKIGEGGGDDTEDIRAQLVPLSEIYNYLQKYQQDQKGLVDFKIYVGLALLQEKFKIFKES